VPLELIIHHYQQIPLFYPTIKANLGYERKKMPHATIINIITENFLIK